MTFVDSGPSLGRNMSSGGRLITYSSDNNRREHEKKSLTTIVQSSSPAILAKSPPLITPTIQTPLNDPGVGEKRKQGTKPSAAMNLRATNLLSAGELLHQTRQYADGAPRMLCKWSCPNSRFPPTPNSPQEAASSNQSPWWFMKRPGCFISFSPHVDR